MTIRSGSLVTNTRQLGYPEEFSGYMTCKTSAAAGSDYRDSEHDRKYSSADDVDRKTQLAETELDTRMESLCLLVTEHALGLDK